MILFDDCGRRRIAKEEYTEMFISILKTYAKQHRQHRLVGGDSRSDVALGRRGVDVEANNLDVEWGDLQRRSTVRQTYTEIHCAPCPVRVALVGRTCE